MAESKEQLKSHLMKEKEESEKADLKLNIQNTKIMVSSPIISQQWQILFSWAAKSLWMVTAATKLMLLGRKAMANPDKVLKSEHHFADKDLYNLSYGFPVFMYGSESWTIMKAKHRKIDAFKLWYGEDC